jgi:hypothetical protein
MAQHTGHRYAKLVRETFQLAVQFGRYTYPDYNIPWSRLRLIDHHDYEISPSSLGRKLFDREDILEKLVNLGQQTKDEIWVEFDPHLNPVFYTEPPTRSIRTQQ